MRFLGLLLTTGVAVWVYFDARRRDARPLRGWALGTFFALGAVLPFYFASRPLLPGEVRRGGRTWNVLRNFAILFGIVAAIGMTLIGTGIIAGTLANPAARVQQALEPALLMSALAFSPSAVLLLVGYSYRQRDVIERDDRPAADATFDRNTGEAHPATTLGWQPVAVLAAMVALGLMAAFS